MAGNVGRLHRQQKDKRRIEGSGQVVADETADTTVIGHKVQAKGTSERGQDESSQHESAVVGRQPIVDPDTKQDC